MQKWPFKYGFIWSSACTIDALSAYLMHSYSCDRPGSCRLVYMGECALETHHGLLRSRICIPPRTTECHPNKRSKRKGSAGPRCAERGVIAFWLCPAMVPGRSLVHV